MLRSDFGSNVRLASKDHSAMTTTLIPLSCNHCGAPLSVPENVRFLTCSHCQTSLSVEQHGDAYFTQELERLSDETQRIGEKVEELQSELRRKELDELWQHRRKRLMVKTAEGSYSVPEPLNALHTVVGMSVFVAIGFIAAMAVLQISSGMSLFLFVGAAMAFILMIANIGHANDQARRYRRAYREYQRQRATLGRPDAQTGKTVAPVVPLGSFLDQLEAEHKSN